MEIPVEIWAHLDAELGSEITLDVEEPVTPQGILGEFFRTYPQFRDAENALTVAVDFFNTKMHQFLAEHGDYAIYSSDSVLDLAKGLHEVNEALRRSLDRDAFPDEIADTLNVEPRGINTILCLSALVFEREFVKRRIGTPEFLRFVTDAATHARSVAKSSLQSNLRDVLSSLTPREEKVLKLLSGLGERRSLTIEEVAADFEISVERVREVQARASRKLRHWTRRGRLKTFPRQHAGDGSSVHDDRSG